MFQIYFLIFVCFYEFTVLRNLKTAYLNNIFDIKLKTTEISIWYINRIRSFVLSNLIS